MAQMQLYVFTSPSGKQYLSVTKKSLSYRINEHSHANTAAGRAIRKYGNKIIAETLVIGEDEYIYALERRAIETLGTMAPKGYNLREGGEGGRHTENSRRKIGQANKGRVFSEEHRRRIGETSKGRTFSEATRHKMSKNRKGRLTGSDNPMWGIKGEAHHCWGKVATVESRRKMSEAQRKRLVERKAKGI